jgi:nitric oxide synthase-interacting protein
MSRHSKNNTSRPIFTYAERQKLKDYGTIKQRLGKDSLKDFDACSLCLHNLVMPLAWYVIVVWSYKSHLR